MLKYCLRKWDENKGVLEEAIRRNAEMNAYEYVDLVKLVVEIILNTSVEEYGAVWDCNGITVVDNGDYQGTQLFLIPAKAYQPCEYEYLMTYCGYGSCSGCDTLMAIQRWKQGLPDEQQVKDFMALCKDIVTNMIKPYNGGWRYKEEFDEVKGYDESETN